MIRTLQKSRAEKEQTQTAKELRIYYGWYSLLSEILLHSLFEDIHDLKEPNI